jgi:hypothetical protein
MNLYYKNKTNKQTNKMENDIDLALAIPVTEYSRSVIDVVMNWLTGQTETEQKSKEDVQYNKLIFNDDQIGVLSTFAECIAYFTTEENPDTDAANWDPAKIAQMIYPSPSYILCVYPEDQIGNVEYVGSDTDTDIDRTTKLDVDGVEIEVTPKKENLTYTRVYLIQDILDAIIEATEETKPIETETTKTKETPDGL